MRKILLIAFAVLALCGARVSAQINKHYFVWLSQDLVMEDRYKEAIDMLNILLRADPSAHEGYFLRGIAKYNLDDLLGAEIDFSLAIEKNPVFTEAYRFRAITRSRLGNYDDALKDFEEAIDLRPDRAEAYFSRGVTYLLTQQFEKAIGDFDVFLKYHDKVAEAYLNRGMAKLYLKDTLQAYEDYNRAVVTNRENPRSYVQRGTLYMDEKRYPEAMADFNAAIRLDSSYIVAYFNRALLYNRQNRPVQALSDFDRVIALDSLNSLTYFNRALVRAEIGDYNRALEDYNKVALYSPGNVIVFYNRAGLYYRIGEYEMALADYDRAIELYPDFANAYMNRSSVKYLLRDEKGSDEDRATAERKIAEYRSKLSDSSFSIYADTSRHFNELLSFDTKLSGSVFQRISTEEGENITLRPLYRFTFYGGEPVSTSGGARYMPERMAEFLAGMGPGMVLANENTNIRPDSLLSIDNTLSRSLSRNAEQWEAQFKRGITQSLIRQYTNAVNTFSAAIELNPANPFLYINRSTTQAEMTDFISSIDNSYNRISLESDPSPRLRSGGSNRTYNYDEAIADLNKAAKLYPEFAYIYYNRANLLALSGQYPEAFEDYSKAIELNPLFADAWFNRGLVQIYMKDTRKGMLDISKAGELGIKEAYAVLKRYSDFGD